MYHKVNYPTTVRKKITVKSFSGGVLGGVDEIVSDLSKASLSYNFDYSSGALTSGTGICPYDAIYDVTALNNVDALLLFELLQLIVPVLLAFVQHFLPLL